jgi:hypothetical protein
MSSPSSTVTSLRIPPPHPSLRWILTTSGGGSTQLLGPIYANHIVSSFDINGISVAAYLCLRVSTQERPRAHNRLLLDDGRSLYYDLLLFPLRVSPLFHLRL